MTPPRLSICIATLNRASFLAETLDNVIAQCRDEIEIVIVDGASTDGTAAVVAARQERYGQITYLRLSEKGGVDQDYARAVELARGEYCWLFTDDDLLRPGAVDAVLAGIQREFDLIVVNAEVRDADMSHRLQAQCMVLEHDVEFAPEAFEELFRTTANYLSFIGGVVIKRAVWMSRDARAYFGTVFVHVGVIFQAPPTGRSLVISEPYIAIRYGNALWSSKSFEISLFKWPGLIWSFRHFSEAAKQAVSAREPWRSPTALVVFRARGAYGVAEYRQWLQRRLGSAAARAWARLVAVAPACLLNALLIAYFTLSGRRHSSPEIRLVDLRSAATYYRRCLTGGVSRRVRTPP